VLRGNHAARIDDKGRLKIPNAFRALIQGQHGTELFVTSLTGEYVRIYPMPVWMALEEKLARMPSTHPARIKFFDRVNYFGQAAAIDTQGRLLVPSILREVAGIASDVVVLGNTDHLIVWNEERIQNRLKANPLTPEDMKELELHGV